MTLKRKILLRIYVLTFLIIVAMSVTYYYLFTNNIRKQSHQRITTAFDLIVDDLHTRMDNIVPKIEQFVQTSLMSPLYMIRIFQDQQQEAKQEPSIWDITKTMTYLSGIAIDMQEFGKLIDVEQILIYDQQRQLLAAYLKQDGEPLTGVYLSAVRDGVFAPILPNDLWYAMLQTLDEIPQQPLPSYIPLHYEGDVPERTTAATDTLTDLMTLRFTSPIVENGDIQGICVLHVGIRQQDVERYARLSGMNVNVFTGSALSVGTLSDYNFIPGEFTKTRYNLDLLFGPDLPTVNFSNVKIRGNSYYQGTLALGDMKTLAGAIAVNLPRHLEEQEKKNFFLVVAGITLFFSILVAAEAFGLSAAIVRPITRLMVVMKDVRTGNFDATAPVDTNDEIGQLAETFNTMTAQLKASFDKIEQQHRQVQRQNQELQQLDKLKDEFLANTSHELRTPLNGIAGLAEALLSGVDGPLNNQERRHVRMIMQSSKRLANLVNALLDFSKVKAQKIQLHLKPFPITEVVDIVCTFSQELIQEKPVTFKVDIPEDLPEVYADIDKVEQILTNLVDNAAKFTRQGTINISAQQEGDMVRISVQDTGIGIPREACKRIFQPFEQVDGSATREFGGTGLGLAISKELIELHNGNIWVESEVDKGSSFHFTLPCKENGIEEKTAEARELIEEERLEVSKVESYKETVLAEREPIVESDVSGAGYTVLIIDDDPTNVEVLRTQLVHDGFTVLEASNGKEAFEIINGHQVDLILCDVMMPLVDGYTFAMRVREYDRLRNIPLIFVSAKDQKTDIIKGYQAGGVDYLTKPVEKDELLLKIHTILDLRQRTQEQYVSPEAVKTHDTIYETEHDKEEQYARIRQGNGETILVVDDEPINIEVFKTHLTQYNYRVVTAFNGPDALKKIEQEPPDLVLLDLMMPRMSGFHVCQIIREEKQLWDLPVIMLTAKSNIYDKVYGLNVGASDYIIKPFHRDELLTRIHVLLSISALQKELIQKNTILQMEIVERTQAEQALRRLNEELEQRVVVRTVDLQQSLESLKKTQMQLVQSEKMAALGALVAGIAHELNTPIGISITAVSHLQDTTHDIQHLYAEGNMTRSDLEGYLKTAGASTGMILKNLQRASNQIQNFKQAAVDQSELGKRRFPIKEYLKDTVLSLRSKLSQTKHAITVSGDDSITIESYPGALSQIATSLLMNSVTHAYREGEQGNLCFKLMMKQNRLIIQYTDNGCGIPSEHLNKIFDPFFTTARGTGGTGLGLHIVYNLVTQKLKGNIHCESQIGEGTTFIVDLPVSL